jgi:hypothetical protein
MAIFTSSDHKLIQAIDDFVVRHGAQNEELKRDLLSFRAQLDIELRNKRLIDVASISVRVATLVKFFIDQMPPH